MKRIILTSALLGLLAAGATPAFAAGVGDRAPEFEGKEFLFTEPVDMKALAGKVVLFEVFRTW